MCGGKVLNSKEVSTNGTIYFLNFGTDFFLSETNYIFFKFLFSLFFHLIILFLNFAPLKVLFLIEWHMHDPYEIKILSLNIDRFSTIDDINF